jgi:AcrR family transcriptional regulator
MSPRGRRPGGVDTRAAIIDAARSEFAAQGYDATSLRGIARAAGVDPALVHHYFGGKPQVFVEVMSIPVDLASLVGGVVAAPRDQVGEVMVRTFLHVWDAPDGRLRFQALMRSAASHEEAARMLREFLVREVFGKVTAALAAEDGPDGPDGVDLRGALAAGQMVGMAMLRYVLEFPAVVEASQEELVAQLAPVLQGYLAPYAP